MTCKDCRWLTVAPDKIGRRVVRSSRAYRCSVAVPDVDLPTSVTMEFSFRWPPHRVMVCGTDGVDCPCWEERGS